MENSTWWFRPVDTASREALLWAITWWHSRCRIERCSVQRFRVDLDHMPVGIDDIDLRITGGRLRFDLHLVEVPIIPIFSVAFGAQEFQDPPVTGNPNCKMNIARVDSFVRSPERSIVMHDEMQMLRVPHFKPGPRKRKSR